MYSVAVDEGVEDIEATNIAPLFTKSTTLFQDLEVDFQNYSLKCLTGAFKNKYLYISTSKQGEIIGNGPYNSVNSY